MNVHVKFAFAAVSIAASATMGTLVIYPLIVRFADAMEAVTAVLN